MQRFFQSRGTAELSEPVHRQLAMYALAASAAGVGVMALTRPAAAEIVYTPANQSIGPITYLDLNHDGINDFKFTTHVRTTIRTGTSSRSAALAVYGASAANKISGESVFASALPPGAYVGPAGKFQGQKMAFVIGGFVSRTFYGRSGFWAGPAGRGIEHRYLGFKFAINGEIHFGWARLNVVISNLKIQTTLTGYAYETIPNKRIIAGRKKGIEVDQAAEPASLGRLAQGSGGLTAWRSGK